MLAAPRCALGRGVVAGVLKTGWQACAAACSITQTNGLERARVVSEIVVAVLGDLQGLPIRVMWPTPIIQIWPTINAVVHHRCEQLHLFRPWRRHTASGQHIKSSSIAALQSHEPTTQTKLLQPQLPIDLYSGPRSLMPCIPSCSSSRFAFLVMVPVPWSPSTFGRPIHGQPD